MHTTGLLRPQAAAYPQSPSHSPQCSGTRASSVPQWCCERRRSRQQDVGCRGGRSTTRRTRHNPLAADAARAGEAGGPGDYLLQVRGVQAPPCTLPPPSPPPRDGQGRATPGDAGVSQRHHTAAALGPPHPHPAAALRCTRGRPGTATSPQSRWRQPARVHFLLQRHSRIAGPARAWSRPARGDARCGGGGVTVCGCFAGPPRKPPPLRAGAGRGGPTLTAQVALHDTICSCWRLTHLRPTPHPKPTPSPPTCTHPAMPPLLPVMPMFVQRSFGCWYAWRPGCSQPSSSGRAWPSH